MSELSSSPTTSKKTRHLSRLLLSDLFLFCSLVLSHPLYFSYLIFFSPYLFKLLSFLSPLFVTTFLLLLALLTISPNLVNHDISHGPEFCDSKVSFIFSIYQAAVERLRSKVDQYDENEGFHHQFEELEAYKIVFETSSNLDITEDPIQVLELESKGNCSSSTQALNGNLDETSVLITRPQSDHELIAEVKTLRGLLHQKEEFEDSWCQKGEKEVSKPLNGNFNKVDEEQKEEPSMMRWCGSKAIGQRTSEAKVVISDDDSAEYYYSPKLRLEAINAWSPNNGGDNIPSKAEDNSQVLQMGCNLGSFGSMRKEKEWRRTLACKLFEERHNAAGGGEGMMDLLWETYETTDSVANNKAEAKSKINKGKKSSSSSINEYYDDEEEEEEDKDGQLCCLQALKFSAGKMNLGMGRPNLVKISKALKGIGWLHHVGRRHAKKGYH